MRKYIALTLSGILLIGLVSSFIKGGEPIEVMEVGTTAPLSSTKMAGIDGKKVSLEDLKKENGLLVVFSCNTCPFVVGSGDKEGWEGRYNTVSDDCSDKNVGMVLVNSNEAKRDKGDNLKDMKARAKGQGYNMAYVLDENSVLADAFGARTTPHVFLFDKNMKLVYRGKIDDSVNSAASVKETYLKDALQNLIDGKTINPSATKGLGCSIKRVG